MTKRFTAPNLNVMAVHRALGLGYGLAVVATNQRLKADEMSINTDGVGPDIPSPILQRPQLARNEFGHVR
jgi:hypothetical protein